MKLKILVIFSFIMCCFSISVNAQVAPGPAVAPSPYATDNLNRLLISASAASPTGETLAGSAVTTAGTWNPSPVSITFSGSIIPVPVPSYTFVLVRIQ